MSQFIQTEREANAKKLDSFVVTNNLKSAKEVERISKKLGESFYVLLECGNKILSIENY